MAAMTGRGGRRHGGEEEEAEARRGSGRTPVGQVGRRGGNGDIALALLNFIPTQSGETVAGPPRPADVLFLGRHPALPMGYHGTARLAIGHLGTYRNRMPSCRGVGVRQTTCHGLGA